HLHSFPTRRSSDLILQHLQQIVASPLGPGIQFQLFQPLLSFLAPQLLFFCKPWFKAMCCNWFFTRVRICTNVCRCFSNCRRSRSSTLGTQILGNRFSTSRSSRCWASRLSVNCCLRGFCQ